MACLTPVKYAGCWNSRGAPAVFRPFPPVSVVVSFIYVRRRPRESHLPVDLGCGLGRT